MNWVWLVWPAIIAGGLLMAVGVALVINLVRGDDEETTMFDDCKTVDEVAKQGPIEQPALDDMLRQVGRPGDVFVARRLAEERMRSGSNEDAKVRYIRFIG